MTDYATLLRHQVTPSIQRIDRIFLQAYQPQLQSPGQVAWFLNQWGFPFPSSAAVGQTGEKYVAVIKRVTVLWANTIVWVLLMQRELRLRNGPTPHEVGNLRPALYGEFHSGADTTYEH